MAVGGVRPENIREYFSSGADAVAFGGSVFSKERFANKEFKEIERSVSEYVQVVRETIK